MKSSLFFLLAVGQSLASPVKRDDDDLVISPGWPEYCDNVRQRGPDRWNEYKHSTSPLDRWFPIMASINYGQFKKSSRDVSIINWAAAFGGYNWQCDLADCDVGDFSSKCKSSATSVELGLVLESAANLHRFIKSLQEAIQESRISIGDALPSMFDTFGAPEDSDEAFDDTIGMLPGVAGVIGASAYNLPQIGIAASIPGVATAIAEVLSAEEEKEQKFTRFAEASKRFSANIDIV